MYFKYKKNIVKVVNIVKSLFFFFYKMRFKTNYKSNVSFLLLLGQNAARFFVKLKFNTILI